MTKSRLHTRGKKIRERSIDVRTGHEGPREDPYGWTEVTVVTNGVCVVAHLGLMEYLEVDGNPVYFRGRHSVDKITQRFEQLTGLRPDEVARIYEKRFYFEDPMGRPSDYE